MIRHVSNTSDGVSIGIEVFGTGDTVLLVHGTTSEKKWWMDFIERQSSKYTVIAYDRRGRGDSGDHSDYSIEKEFDDLVAVLESVDEPVNLFGHSSGAIIALEASAKISEKVAKLILYEPLVPTGIPVYDREVLERIQGEIGKRNNAVALEMFYLEVVKMPFSDLAQLKQSPLWELRVNLAHTIPRELFGFGQYKFEKDNFKGCQLQTLLLLGGDSPEIFSRSTDLLSATLVNSEVKTIAGEKHHAMVTNPKLFDQILEEYIDREANLRRPK